MIDKYFDNQGNVSSSMIGSLTHFRYVSREDSKHDNEQSGVYTVTRGKNACTTGLPCLLCTYPFDIRLIHVRQGGKCIPSVVKQCNNQMCNLIVNEIFKCILDTDELACKKLHWNLDNFLSKL